MKLLNLNLNFILLILFIGISVWLSLLVRSLKNEVSSLNISNKSITKETIVLTHKLDFLNDLLALNFQKHPTLNNTPLSLLFSNLNEVNFTLYLKAYSCSDCNISTISTLIEKLSIYDNFTLISHTSNKYFIEELLSKETIKEIAMVHYIEDKFIRENNPIYDAEILIIDSKLDILGRLPLELLKEFELFESLFEKIVAINSQKQEIITQTD
ncbi:MAG: hypothetical protein KGZ97_03480 [Bacteroidetes bacterium]|nr:hypothetical protein [Bacteroidota bacterium]